MELGIIVAVIVAITVGVIVGAYVEKYRFAHRASQGTLNVDYSDPEDGPYLFLELKVPIVDVVSRKRVIFDVNESQYVSQK